MKNPFSALPGDMGYVSTPEAVERAKRPPPGDCLTCLNCPDCQSNFYMLEEQHKPSHSYHFRLSDAETERRVSLAVERIHHGRSLLQERLNTFADLLMSRWKKHSQEKRAALLKDAAPHLAEKQWTVPRYFYKTEHRYRREGSLRARHQLLVPWLSVEVLKTKPAALFALLHYRTAYPPQDWAAYDSGQLTKTWAHGWVNVDFSPKCVVMHGQGYGQVVDWDKQACHRADILGFPRAILVLDAQVFLLETLCRVVDKILAGVDSSQPPRAEKWRDIATTAAFKEAGKLESWSPYTNQPFSAPPKFDSEQLLSLARSRLAETGDHLWYLQCDAAYFRRHLKILLAAHNFDNATEAKKCYLLVGHVYRQIMDHYWWRWIEIEWNHVDELRKRFRDSIYPGQPLPKPYDRALGALELLLVNQVIYRTKTLNKLVPFVEGLKQHYTTFPCPEFPEAIGRVKRKACGHSQDWMEKQPLDWCLDQLYGGPDNPDTSDYVNLVGSPDHASKFDYAMLFGFLENHLTNVPEDKKKLDEVIYQVLSDLSTCHEMLVAVRLHRPQNKCEEARETLRDEDREAWKWLRSEGRIKKKDLALIQSIGIAIKRNFHDMKPLNNSKPAARLAHKQMSNDAMETFWQSMRGLIRRDLTQSYLSELEVESLLQVVSANLTPEYLRNKQQEEDAILAAPSVAQATQYMTHLFDHADAQPSNEQIIPPRQKTKTRGDPSDDDLNLVAQYSADAQDKTEVTGKPVMASPIAVTAESQHLFRRMFPDNEKMGNDVPWDRFVRAMVDAGFSAMHSGGSAVSFSKISGTGGKIVFHRPHPDPKIDPILLRVMGKRMSNHFGWNRDLFVLRGEAP